MSRDYEVDVFLYIRQQVWKEMQPFYEASGRTPPPYPTRRPYDGSQEDNPEEGDDAQG